jgi:hypothetical protein
VLVRLVLAKLVDRISQFGVLGHAATRDNRPEGLRLQRRRLGIEIREVERDIEGTAKRLPYGAMRRTGHLLCITLRFCANGLCWNQTAFSIRGARFGFS